MTSNTIELAERMARASAAANAAKERAHALDRLTIRRNICWVGGGASFLTALIVSIGHWTGKIEVPAGVISWLGLGLTTFALLGGIATQITINQVRSVDEIRDARPADAEAIGQLAREQEAQQDLLLQIHGALILAESRELHRNRQWEAELTLFRENGRKLFEGIHEHMAQEFDAMRRSVAALAETVVHAKGVAINGHDTKAGAQVIQLPSQDTIQALRRLAHRTAQVAEDNFEDTTG